MKTDEIRHALRNVRQFGNVYSVDTLPRRPRGLLVCNLDVSYRPGTHWVVIYVDGDSGRGEYFDSFGRPPSAPIRAYLDRWCKRRWTYNDRQLQSVVSLLCGQYCIFYCALRDKGITLRQIVNCFTTDTALNDELVHAFACRRRFN